MKNFEVVLTKSYIVKIKAENEDKAKRYAELFTSDIFDLSTEEHRKNFVFEIQHIDCKINEVIDTKELI